MAERGDDDATAEAEREADKSIAELDRQLVVLRGLLAKNFEPKKVTGAP